MTVHEHHSGGYGYDRVATPTRKGLVHNIDAWHDIAVGATTLEGYHYAEAKAGVIQDKLRDMDEREAKKRILSSPQRYLNQFWHSGVAAPGRVRV